MMTVILLVNLSALILLLRYGLPRPFPWKASALLGAVLLISGWQNSNGLARGAGFITLLSALVVMQFIIRRFPLTLDKFLYTAAWALTAFLVADALRLFPTPDIAVTSGETFALVRRPYLLEHPNVKACWLLLISVSAPSLIGILFAQSRGALLAWLAASFRFVPRRFALPALIGCALFLASAAFIRPGTFFGRVDIWSDAAQMFLASPIVGHGSGTYAEVTGGSLATAHNAALTIAAENGLIGLAAFAAWVFGAGALVIHSSHAAKFNLFAFSVQQVVDDQWLHPVTAILLGAMLAVCIFHPQRRAGTS